MSSRVDAAAHCQRCAEVTSRKQSQPESSKPMHTNAQLHKQWNQPKPSPQRLNRAHLLTSPIHPSHFPSRIGTRQAKRATKPPSKTPPTAQKLVHLLAQRLLHQTSPTSPPKTNHKKKKRDPHQDCRRKRPDVKNATTKFPSVLALLQPAVVRDQAPMRGPADSG